MEDYIQENELHKIFFKENQNNFIPDIFSMEETHILMLEDKYSGPIIINKKISGNALTSVKIQGIKFYNCLFKDCDLTGNFYWMCIFQDCVFENCILERSVFRKCEIKITRFAKCHSRFYLNISESYIFKSSFTDCLFEGIEISGTDTFAVEFKLCTLSMGRFQANFTYRDNLTYTPKEYHSKEDIKLLNSKRVFNDLQFTKCIIDFMDFRMMRFLDAKFRNCEISKCSFNESILYTYNIDDTNNKKGWGTNSIDLLTLKESEYLSASTLKNIFNIDRHSQEKIKDLLKKKILSSVFISYSLKDGEIAKKINDYLKSSDVTTFLWEKDAPGGRPLNSIMKSNIDTKDRVLFIASENSLKSDACHYELSQGRQKQDKLWTTILFPIHLDEFIFKIDYDQIKPKAKRDEYWENILELREINSLDFSEFKNGVIRNKRKFNHLMEKLITSLKIE